MEDETRNSSEPVEPSQSAEAPPGSDPSSQDAPPINVYSLIHYSISLFSQHAWQSLGLIPDQQGKIESDLEQARVAVDCAAALAQHLEGALQEEDVRELRRMIQDLKINYVKQREKSKEGSAQQ